MCVYVMTGEAEAWSKSRCGQYAADCEAVGVIVVEAEAARQWEYLLALDIRYSLNGSRG